MACKSHSASHRIQFCKPYYIPTLSASCWTSLFHWRICFLHSTWMFISSCYCIPVTAGAAGVPASVLFWIFLVREVWICVFYNLFFFSVAWCIPTKWRRQTQALALFSKNQMFVSFSKWDSKMVWTKVHFSFNFSLKWGMLFCRKILVTSDFFIKWKRFGQSSLQQ